MNQVELRKLVPEDESKPLASQTQRFITMYVAERDVETAARRANILAPKAGETLYNEPRVRARIDRKIELVDTEEARIKARSNLLTVPLVDACLVDQIRRRERVAPEMFKVAYGRVGLVKDGEFYIAPDPNQVRTQPGIYQRQTTAKRTVTEELTRTEIVVDPIFAVREY